jgi:hypothetical protein
MAPPFQDLGLPATRTDYPKRRQAAAMFNVRIVSPTFPLEEMNWYMPFRWHPRRLPVVLSVERAPYNWYIEAREAQELGLMRGVL